MTEHRNFDGDLVELALGEVTEPRRSELLAHLGDCDRCRSAYGEVTTAIDVTVPAAPESQPPAGFDLRVLAALGIEPDDGAGPRGGVLTRWVTPRTLLAAATVVSVAAAGVWGGATLLDDDTDGERDLAAGSAVLATSEGERVGTATVAWLDEQRVLVVSVNQAPTGVGYTCRVLRAEGTPKTLGRWEASSPDGGTWVVPAPPGELDHLELVTDSGNVWSSARLP